MARSTHVAIVKADANGVDVHVDPATLKAAGVRPGDEALVELRVRSNSVDEWVDAGAGRVFFSDEEFDAYLRACPTDAQG